MAQPQNSPKDKTSIAAANGIFILYNILLLTGQHQAKLAFVNENLVDNVAMNGFHFIQNLGLGNLYMNIIRCWGGVFQKSLFLTVGVCSYCVTGKCAPPTSSVANIFDRQAYNLGPQIVPPEITLANYYQGEVTSEGEPKDPVTSWHLNFTGAPGYDSNPGAQHSPQGAWFGYFDFNVAFSYFWSVQDNLIATYEVESYVYGNHSYNLDSDNNNLDVLYSHFFSQDLSANFDAKETFGMIGGKAFLNKGDFIATIGRNWHTGSIRTEIQGEYANLDSLFPSATPAQNGSANLYSPGVNLILTPADLPLHDSGWALRQVANMPVKNIIVSYGHSWNQAQGSDNVFHGDKVLVKLAAVQTGIPKLTADLVYSHFWRFYSNPNSLSPTLAPRANDTDILSFELDYNTGLIGPLKAKFFAKYDYTFQHSNILKNEYGEEVVRAGVTIKL